MKLRLTACKDVKLLDLEFEPDGVKGAVTPRFVLTCNRVNAINISVPAAYDGEPVQRSSRIYVRANKASQLGSAATAF